LIYKKGSKETLTTEVWWVWNREKWKWILWNYIKWRICRESMAK